MRNLCDLKALTGGSYDPPVSDFKAHLCGCIQAFPCCPSGTSRQSTSRLEDSPQKITRDFPIFEDTSICVCKMQYGAPKGHLAKSTDNVNISKYMTESTYF